ncbi:MAG: hypothetical protein ACLR8P_11095 [Clostridium fessum]
MLRGKDVIEVPELKAGDIGAVAETLRDTDRRYDRRQICSDRIPQTEDLHTRIPTCAFAAKTKGDEDKISSALAKNDGRRSDTPQSSAIPRTVRAYFTASVISSSKSLSASC